MPLPEKWIFVGPGTRLTRSWPDARADCGRQADSSPGIRGQLHEQTLRGFCGSYLGRLPFCDSSNATTTARPCREPLPRPPCREALPIVSRGSSSRKQEGRGPRTIDLSHPASQHDTHSSRETPPDAEYQARLLHLLGFGNWLRMRDDGPSWFRGVRRRFQFFYLSIAA
jgi:hypothetical protein